MKRFLLSVVLATSLALTSCQFDDSDIWDKFGEMEESIRDHEQRISALEELCKQMNTNIEALQTLVDALEKRDYITNISPIREDGVVIGYTISFGKSDTITIYHGQDGKDGANGADGKDGANGADGKDGYTPQIGVMKDTDNVYYWTLDGEWLLDAKGNKIKAVGTDGADGKDGQDGANGTDGQDGQDGTNGSDGKDGQDGQDGTNGSDGKDGQDGTNGIDGKDGVTPQLKIENDYWYVSYDNGATWVQLGKATGEDGKDGQDGNDGADGADGEDGDSIFKSVTQDDEYVYFNLADGTMITLPKHDKENIQFEDLLVKAICCKNWDTNNDGELSYAEAAAVETIGTKFKDNTNIIAFTELKYFTGIAEIPASAFAGCTALWKIELPKTVGVIGYCAFIGCSNLVNMCFHEGVTVIGKYAFRGCTALNRALKNIKFPSTLIEIGGGAFNDIGDLGDVIIPEGVYLSGYCAFDGCRIGVLTLSKGCCFEVQSLYFTGVEVDTAYVYCVIPNGETNSGQFSRALFKEVIIGDNITRIGYSAFEECEALKSLTIGKGVSSIGYHAFYECSALKTIYCRAINPPKWDDSYIFDNVSDRKIYVPMASVDAYKAASGWKTYASQIEGYEFE